MLLCDCYSPLTICPRAIVEVSSFSTDNVKPPTWRQVLELIILTACLCLFPILLLHGHQTCTHTHTQRNTFNLLHVLFQYTCITPDIHCSVCVCVHVPTRFILVIVDVNIIGLHHHKTFSHQPGWSKSE